MKAFLLSFKSPLRTDLRSDTLWGLILHAVSAVHGKEKAAWVVQQTIAGNPPFLVSSAFPFLSSNGKEKLFFPNPYTQCPVYRPSSGDKRKDIRSIDLRKKRKRVQFVERAELDAFISGQRSFGDYTEDESVGMNEPGMCIEWDAVLHTTIDRLTGTTLTIRDNGTDYGQLFYTYGMHVKKGGFFFLAKGDSALIETALRFYQHVGVGADRATGAGHFSWTSSDVNFTTPHQPGHAYLLGTYVPSLEEAKYFSENQAACYYELETRYGRSHSTISGGDSREKTGVLGMRAGSILPLPQTGLKGSLREVGKTADHTLYHNGMALYLPVQLKGYSHGA